MTALKPLESFDIRAVTDHDEERKLLRKAVLNRVCAHPDCDEKQVEGHHLFPRSFISNSSWFVRVGEEKPILHVTGLCRQHHSDVEEHRAWVRFEDGVWNWYELGVCSTGNSIRYSCPDYDINLPSDCQECGGGCWVLVGPLSPQPGEVAAPKKPRKRKQGVERRKRRTISIAVPHDQQEDGAGVLDDLIQTGRELWADEIGWSEDVPPYFVICAAFAKALQ